MTYRIIKHQIPVDDEWHELELRHGGVVHVDALTKDVVRFWTIDSKEQPAEPNWFRVYGTGHFVDSDDADHCGTALFGPFVWHLFVRYDNPGEST